MSRRRFSIILLFLISLITFPSVVQAATITTCAFDKDVYDQGETGYITVTIYNDENDKIRITELTAVIDYFYADGTAYLQTFLTNATLPVEIQANQSISFYIPFSLPTNIAPGYTKVNVKAKTELWNNQSEIWFGSEHPTYQTTFYIESPYKQQFEEQQLINEDLQEQMQELQTTNLKTTNMMYVYGATTALFALMMTFFIFRSRRARVTN